MDTDTASGPRAYAKSRFSEAERLAIAAAIKDHMARSGIHRKTLQGPNLKLGIINKAMAGGFSDETLAKIENVLGRSFAPPKQTGPIAEAAKALGGYSREDAAELEGDYLCIRPTFAKPHVFTAYKIKVFWDKDRVCLRFSESERFDVKYTQSGDVYNPPKKPFFTLLTAEIGSVRMVTLSMPDECGVARGILTTLNNPHGVNFTPTSTPVILIKSEFGYFKQFGLIKPGCEFYEKARDLIESVITEECAQFITDVRAPSQTHEFSI